MLLHSGRAAISAMRRMLQEEHTPRLVQEQAIRKSFGTPHGRRGQSRGQDATLGIATEGALDSIDKSGLPHPATDDRAAGVSPMEIQTSDMRAEKSQLVTQSGSMRIATSLAASRASIFARRLRLGMR